MFTFINEGSLHGVMFKVLAYGFIESEFELHSRYYVHLRTNTLEKGMNLLPLSNSITVVLLQGLLKH